MEKTEVIAAGCRLSRSF